VPSKVFELTNPASERPQTHELALAATGVGSNSFDDEFCYVAISVAVVK